MAQGLQRPDDDGLRQRAGQMSKSIVAVLLAALALTACDKPNYPEPLHDWAALVS